MGEMSSTLSEAAISEMKSLSSSGYVMRIIKIAYVFAVWLFSALGKMSILSQYQLSNKYSLNAIFIIELSGCVRPWVHFVGSDFYNKYR
jgi:hypothetical protein